MYSKEKKEAALKLLKDTHSVSKMVRILGYPTRRQLYQWKSEINVPNRERELLPRIANPPEHPRNPPVDIKLNAIRRCFERKRQLNHT